MRSLVVGYYETQGAFAILAVVCIMICSSAYGQETGSPSIGVFAGAGVQHDIANRGAMQVGGSVDQSFPNHWIGYMFEGGFEGPFSNLRGGGSAFLGELHAELAGCPHFPVITICDGRVLPTFRYRTRCELRWGRRFSL
jgi:hypothetical protein